MNAMKKYGCRSVSHFAKAVSFLAVLLLISAVGAKAQSAAFATISGRALDPKGASVAGATVTAANTETGITRTTQTTSDGLYRFENLPPGLYNVTIEASGFAKGQANAVKLQVGEQRDINFNLELAGQQQSVVVTSELPLIEATKTDTSTVIDEKAVADLPTTTSFAGLGGISNDYEGLAASAPGVRYDYTGLSFDILGPGATNSRGLTVNLDGGNISDQVVSSRDALGASVEEVKEFQVLTNNYNAEYGQAGNVILNVITKSGTNAIHGDAHGYFRGRNLGASDFFYNQTACDPTLTGPGSCDSRADAGFPTSRAPFFKHEEGFTAGGPFIKDRLFWFGSLERSAQALPETLTPFGTSITTSVPTTELLWSGKVDAKLTDKHQLNIRYNIQRDIQSNLIVQTGPAVDPSGLTASVVHDNVLNIGMVSTPTPHTVNEARFFWHRLLSQTPDVSTKPGEALPGAYVGADFCCPQGAFQQRFQYIDNFSWVHGAHTMKAGTSISHFPYQSLFQQYHFGLFSNFAAGGCTNTLFPQANGLCPTQFTTGAGPGFVGAFDTIYGAYVQDTWQLRPTVVLNYGIRYDYEDGAFRGGTIPGQGGACFQSNGLIPACGQDKNNWQPRLGIAWSPNFQSGPMHLLFGDSGKSVVRLSGAVVTEMAYLNIALDSLNFDGKNLLTASIAANDCFLANGSANPSPANTQACAVLTAYPNAPAPSSLVPFTGGSVANFGRVRPISPTIKNPNIYMGALTIQRQIGTAFTYSVGYQGVFGHGLFGERDSNLNQPVADPNHPGFFYMPATGVNDRPNTLFGAIRTNFSNRDSSYHSLVLTAQQRLAHHFQAQASYIFSKTLGNGEDFFGLSEPGNPFASLSLDRALSQQDIRHLANFSFVTDTNRLISTPLLKELVNDWTFSVLGSIQSGRPYPVSTGDGFFTGSAFAALGSETNQRPNICAANSAVPGCAGAPAGALVATNIGSIAGTNLEIGPAGVAACQAAGLANCAALQTTFAPPVNTVTGQSLASGFGPVDSYAGTPVDFQFLNGNLVRNAGFGPGLVRFDLSLMKAIRVPRWESASLELKLDVFNVFNHVMFIANDSNDVLSAIQLPPLTVGGAANPNFNCAAACLNPFTGLYLGRNGNPLTLSTFLSGRADKNLNPNVTNFMGLGNPASDVTPRILQLGIRFRW
ncbi:MAG TPA: TonB-dependent receptor [Candidatus Acidoferrum sp.]|nr:TonB-dependent receptor [Candidatus Acidoferrum sp.]